jgi:hypothetical protein
MLTSRNTYRSGGQITDGEIDVSCGTWGGTHVVVVESRKRKKSFGRLGLRWENSIKTLKFISPTNAHFIEHIKC